MGSLGDVASALAPAAQGISAGQLASAQQNLEQQHYQNALGLQKQTMQNEAKRIQIQQDTLENTINAQKAARVAQVLGDLKDAAFNPAYATSDAARAHQAGYAQLYNVAAARYAAGDIDGAAAALQHGDDWHAATGGAAGMPAPPPSATAAATEAAAPAAAQPAQAQGIPPEVGQALAGLAPVLGSLIAPAAGAAMQAAPQAAPQAAEAAQAAPPAAPAQPDTSAMPPPVAGPYPPPGSVQTAQGTVVPSEIAKKYAGTGVNPYNLTQLAQLDARDNELRAIQRAPRDPNETDANYKLRMDDARQELKDNAAARNKIIEDAQARHEAVIKDQLAQAKADEDRAEKAKEAQQASADRRYVSDNAVRAAIGAKALTQAHWQQEDDLRRVGQFNTDANAQKGILMVQARDLAMVLRTQFAEAMKEQDTKLQGGFSTTQGGVNIGSSALVGELVQARLNGSLQQGTNYQTRNGIVVKPTEGMLAYLDTAAQMKGIADELNNIVTIHSVKQLNDIEGPNPRNAAIVERATRTGDTTELVRTFQSLAAQDATKGLAVNLLQKWQSAHAGEPLPEGMSLSAVMGRRTAPLKTQQAPKAPTAPPVLPPAGTAFPPGAIRTPGGHTLVPANPRSLDSILLPPRR